MCGRQEGPIQGSLKQCDEEVNDLQSNYGIKQQGVKIFSSELRKGAVSGGLHSGEKVSSRRSSESLKDSKTIHDQMLLCRSVFRGQSTPILYISSADEQFRWQAREHVAWSKVGWGLSWWTQERLKEHISGLQRLINTLLNCHLQVQCVLFAPSSVF